MELKQGKTKVEVPEPSWFRVMSIMIMHHSKDHLSKLRNIKKGEILYRVGPRQIQSTPTYLTVQIGEGKHVPLSIRVPGFDQSRLWS